MVAVRRPPDCRSNVVSHGASRCTGEEKECDGDQGIGRRSQTLVTIFSHCWLRCSRTRVVELFFFLALEGCNRKNFQRSTFHERLKFLLFDWQRVGWANFIAQSTVKEKKIESWICLLQIIYSIISSVWLLFICAFLFTMKNHFR